MSDTDDSDGPSHNLLAELHTSLHACSVETVDDRLFLCGLYELNEEEQVRNGKLVVCDTLATLQRIEEQQEQQELGVTNDTSRSSRSPLSSSSTPAIVTCGSVQTDGGVLDCKVTNYVAAAALSTGRLDLYDIRADPDNGSSGSGSGSANGDSDHSGCDIDVGVVHLGGVSSPDSGLFLSLDWSCGASGYHPHSSGGAGAECNYRQNHIAVSTQASEILIYDASVFDSAGSGSGTTAPIHTITNAHNLYGENVPVWIVAYDPLSGGRRLATGGDDCALRLWDVRIPAAAACTGVGVVSGGTSGGSTQGVPGPGVGTNVFNGPTDNDGDDGVDGSSAECSSTCTATNKKSHTAGVTSAQWHPHTEHLLVTGSYDGVARLWDARMLTRCLWEADVEGGIWRAKWWWAGGLRSATPDASSSSSSSSPGSSSNSNSSNSSASTSSHLALACMHGGCNVFNVPHASEGQGQGLLGASPFRVGKHYRESLPEQTQGHLAYGLALLQAPAHSGSGSSKGSSSGKWLAASCSFYDDIVQLWSVPAS